MVGVPPLSPSARARPLSRQIHTLNTPLSVIRTRRSNPAPDPQPQPPVLVSGLWSANEAVQHLRVPAVSCLRAVRLLRGPTLHTPHPTPHTPHPTPHTPRPIPTPRETQRANTVLVRGRVQVPVGALAGRAAARRGGGEAGDMEHADASAPAALRRQ
eukprot:704830-Rhodomonas_salina.2